MLPLTISELRSQYATGAYELSQLLVDLEAQFDMIEPLIFAFVPEQRRWERLTKQVAILQERFPDPDRRPPLYGVPIGVKDIFHVDGLPTRAGSAIPPSALSEPQSLAVGRLIDAGALIVGKTVTTEFAWFGPGPTRNPHNPFHTPGGSSSGSAAAVAAGLAMLALGSQTIGSVNRPAAYCGVFGFKPTYDRVSKQNVFELSRSHDHVGIFANALEDVVLACSLMCDEWHQVDRYANTQLSVAVPEDGPYMDHVTPSGRRHFDAMCASLRESGVVVRRTRVMHEFERLREAHLMLLAYDAARFHARFAPYHHRYHPKSAELIERGALVDEHAAQTARRAKVALRIELTNALDKLGADVWLTPAAPGPAPVGLESTGNPVMNLPFTCAGLPSLTMPCGERDGALPMAVQAAGRWHDDERLLAVARRLGSILPPLESVVHPLLPDRKQNVLN